VVTGHLTKSIAAYATRLSQARNDNNAKASIPGVILGDYGMGV
jgi:hypothetical protein